MNTQPKECPECKSTGKFFIKKGYFKNKHNHQPVPRYKCKKCGKNFSSHTSIPTKGQKKPFLNPQILNWYASGTTQRRMAKLLHCNIKTIARKLIFIALQARDYHYEEMVFKGKLSTTCAQFDEMETFDHTRMKPLSIAIAVRAKTGQIIDAKVGEMNCHGKLASKAQAKYGFRRDTRAVACEETLKTLSKCQRPFDPMTIFSDAKSAYPGLILKVMPKAIHAPVLSRAVKAGMTSPLFTLNYTAAKIRNDMSRMARKTWVTTKAVWALKAHLYLYIAWNNKYRSFRRSQEQYSRHHQMKFLRMLPDFQPVSFPAVFRKMAL